MAYRGCQAQSLHQILSNILLVYISLGEPKDLNLQHIGRENILKIVFFLALNSKNKKKCPESYRTNFRGRHGARIELDRICIGWEGGEYFGFGCGSDDKKNTIYHISELGFIPIFPNRSERGRVISSSVQPAQIQLEKPDGLIRSVYLNKSPMANYTDQFFFIDRNSFPYNR